MQLILTPLADADIVDIAIYTLSMWGEEQQIKYLEGLNHTLSLLMQNPELGRERRNIRPPCRTIRSQEHIIVYTLSPNHITVLRILHKRMDIQQHI
jgi:toxin ParE1/3/4